MFIHVYWCLLEHVSVYSNIWCVFVYSSLHYCMLFHIRIDIINYSSHVQTSHAKWHSQTLNGTDQHNIMVLKYSVTQKVYGMMENTRSIIRAAWGKMCFAWWAVHHAPCRIFFNDWMIAFNNGSLVCSDWAWIFGHWSTRHAIVAPWRSIVEFYY